MTINYLKNKKYYILASLFCVCYALGAQKIEVTFQHKAIYQTNQHDLQPVAANHSSSGKKWNWQAAVLMLIVGAMAAFIGIALYHASVIKGVYQKGQVMAKQEVQEKIDQLKKLKQEKDEEEDHRKKLIALYGLIKCCFDYMEELSDPEILFFYINRRDILKNLAYKQYKIAQGEELIKQCLNYGRIDAKWRGQAYSVWLSTSHWRCIRDVYTAMCLQTSAFYKTPKINMLICTGYCRQKDAKTAIPQDFVSIIALYTIGC